MLRSCRKVSVQRNIFLRYIQKKSFLTNNYKCTESWNVHTSSSMLTKVNLNDFYNILDQKHSSKGVISAIDVDIFANAVKDPIYLEELKDLLHKLRLSADTVNTLESTHHAVIRNFIEFGQIDELIKILKDPLNFGLFLDDFTANILLDKLIVSKDFDLAANVASLIMLQEDFSNDITCALSQYACYHYIKDYKPKVSKDEDSEQNKKVEEVKIRIKFLRNPYYDDHFDINDPYTLSGKTLAWISEKNSNNLNNNLQLIGWLIYKKMDKLLLTCESIVKEASTKIFTEVISLLKKENENIEPEGKKAIEKCINLLEKVEKSPVSIEEALKTSIENAINKSQNRDITNQQQFHKSWTKLREEKMEEQTKRLDRAKRMQLIQEKKKQFNEVEQRLWFFENEEKIDLQIEDKENLTETPSGKPKVQKSDENYIPPEILPKRK